MKRSPLRPGKALARTSKLRTSGGSIAKDDPGKKRKPIKPESDQRREERLDRAECRRYVLERDGGCLARELPTGVRCQGGIEVHEVVGPRRQTYLEPRWCIALCNAHNQWVSNGSPARARELRLCYHPEDRESIVDAAAAIAELKGILRGQEEA